MVWLLNLSVFQTEAIPGSVIQNITLTVVDTLFLYGLITSILLFAHYKKLVYWAAAFAFVCILSVSHIYRTYHRRAHNQLAIYSIGNHTAISILENGTNYLLADSSLLAQQPTIDFHLAGHWRQSGVKESTFINFYKPNQTIPSFQQLSGNALLVWHGQLFLFVHNSKNAWETIQALQPAYVIVQHNAIHDLTGKEAFLKNLIIDATNKTHTARKLKTQAQQKGISCHWVREDGAFIKKHYNLSRK